MVLVLVITILLVLVISILIVCLFSSSFCSVLHFFYIIFFIYSIYRSPSSLSDLSTFYKKTYFAKSNNSNCMGGGTEEANWATRGKKNKRACVLAIIEFDKKKYPCLILPVMINTWSKKNYGKKVFLYFVPNLKYNIFYLSVFFWGGDSFC